MAMSSSRRERTRQFFRARREPRPAGLAPLPGPLPAVPRLLPF